MTTAMRDRLLWLGLVLSFGVGCDQTSKRIVEHTLGNKTYSFLLDTVRLHFIKNTGAFLGLGSEFPPFIKLWLLFILPSIFLILATIFALLDKNLSLISRIMIALMISGGMGNLIDRLFFSGQVTDFINLGIGPVRTGIFNIADVAIMIGAFGLIFLQAKSQPSKK